MADIDGLWHYIEISVDRNGKISATRDGQDAGSVSISSDAGKSIDAGHFMVGADGYGKWAVNDAMIDELSVIRGLAASENPRLVYAQGLYAYVMENAPALIANAQIYLPEMEEQRALVQSLYEQAAGADLQDPEDLAEKAQVLEAAMLILEEAMPETDFDLMAQISFENQDASDASGRANHGTVHGDVQYGQRITGQAVLLQNVNYGSSKPADQYITFESSEDLRFGSDNFSVALWYKTDDDNRECAIIGNKNWDSGANPGFNLGIVGMGLQANFTPSGASRKDIKPGSIDDGKWHHIVWSIDRAGESVLYVDGKKAGSQNISAYAGKSIDAGNLVIGADINMHYGLKKAWLDEVSVYKRALSQEEAEKMSEAGIFETALQQAEELASASENALRKDNLLCAVASLRSQAAK